MMNRVCSSFENIAELRTLGNKLDQHTKIDMFFKKGTDYEKVQNHRLIWNLSKEKVANAVNVNFQIIQHRDIFGSVCDALGNLNLDVKGRLDDSGDYVKADIIFQGQKEIKDGSKGIQLGIRVSNSNNKKSAFRLEMYAFRIVCQNGMSSGNMIPEVRDAQIHFGIEKIDMTVVQAMIEKFVKKVINNSDKLQELVNESIKDSIEWEILEKIMKHNIAGKKILIEIVKKLGVQTIETIDKKSGRTITLFDCEKTKKFTRWQLYNCLTEYLSHDLQLKSSAITHLELSSQTILKNSFEKLKVLCTK